MKKITNNINIEGAQLIFKNFSGEGSQYNQPGNRNFGVVLSDNLADQLLEDGWNVKYLRPREDDPEQKETPWLPVKVKFNKFPPIAQLITSGGKIKLNEDTIGQLDWTHIEDCDLIIRPYNYPAMNGREAGVSAYLKAIYVIPEENEFDMKYSEVPFADEAPFKG